MYLRLNHQYHTFSVLTTPAVSPLSRMHNGPLPHYEGLMLCVHAVNLNQLSCHPRSRSPYRGRFVLSREHHRTLGTGLVGLFAYILCDVPHQRIVSPRSFVLYC